MLEIYADWKSHLPLLLATTDEPDRDREELDKWTWLSDKQKRMLVGYRPMNEEFAQVAAYTLKPKSITKAKVFFRLLHYLNELGYIYAVASVLDYNGKALQECRRLGFKEVKKEGHIIHLVREL